MEKDSTVHLQLKLTPGLSEPVVAVLSEIGFYAFEEKENGLSAYVLAQDYQADVVHQSLGQYFPRHDFKAQSELIAPKDWNAAWEANFTAVQVGDFCEIRPPFQPPSGLTKHEVVVNPRMAFGTGHHATTWLMVEQCSHLDFEGRSVLDMGCGTGVLAILSRILGAGSATGVDFDPWSYENAPDNAHLNGVDGIQFLLGDTSVLPGENCYDIILANINRNVLLKDRDIYLEHLKPGGWIVLSGIYSFDEDKLTQHYLAPGLVLERRVERGDWVSLAFTKSEEKGI
ncbi:UNVERIFIED_CONTAM: hypothetical protein GTU68_061080 [Idotea baltica]|nr:hypothetical protein [Idotea baltica]